MKKIVLYSFLFGIFFVPNLLLAQTEPEDIASVNNEFENNFFESLKQKGIENYDKAIESLDKCLVLEPNNPVVFFELGKNYLAQRKYPTAYSYFEKVTQIDPKNRWSWVGMYDVCYETKDYNKAIPIVEKLIEFKEEYKEDLVSLYMNTQQYDKALELINQLNETVGKSEKRELYKADILKDAKYQSAEKFNLLDQIKKYPKVESNYIALIYMYSQSNQEEKALEIAQKLEKEIPTSDWAQVSLFKFHLNNNDGEKAVKAMNIVLPSNKIDSKIKHRMLNEFLIFAKNNPQFEPDLDKAISYFNDDKDVKVAKEIGKFYYMKKDWAKAKKYLEMDAKNNADDIESQLLLLQILVELLDFKTVTSKADELTQYYPTEPNFYYYIGLAQNQMGSYKKAKDALEAGLDFIIDDTALEINFYIQLGEAYNGLGDMKKKESYFTKANDLLKKQKK
ncbi:tetratricopeptide repeat protein [Flavobacterium capsici]|uniref:Tetratricopeptide repeat protein n=1 Tax=Flavobacterium capsici TaxID=3075618 RepID=A0AA96EWX8_9FLAO|nr:MULTISPECIES: tetratricopeptide repeat protein [unclassified Flavobacterium]WNM19701.1 tetratricopeptide repeat protein [Flavobacterium sp. PMR2A8]WNM21090.1 tetratricopeptide repeat protein [Flavobacterium sp. PMTSA4]